MALTRRQFAVALCAGIVTPQVARAGQRQSARLAREGVAVTPPSSARVARDLGAPRNLRIYVDRDGTVRHIARVDADDWRWRHRPTVVPYQVGRGFASVRYRRFGCGDGTHDLDLLYTCPDGRDGLVWAQDDETVLPPVYEGSEYVTWPKAFGR